MKFKLPALILVSLPLLFACQSDTAVAPQPQIKEPSSRYLDNGDGNDWPGYGRTFGQQHYSPLAQVTPDNIDQLDLAWYVDLPPLKNSATQPIAVDGVLFFASGLSVIHAVDAVSGDELWRYDPEAATKAGLNLRHGWGVRGIAWWDGKIYTGTVDGRLLAVDAESGELVWSVQTFDPDMPAHINGAPRVFDGKVIIGYASAAGATRGFVTTYDADTGERLWRFHTVPGNPEDGFENNAMAMAAKTWSGEWWNRGGGGANVWNAITYDAQEDTVFIGTGSAYSHNRKIRSNDEGDNLFVSSIIALSGESGEYKWHYQTTPGDAWDYDAVMDMQLADLEIDGEQRKVLMQAPKNGFYYVIDRLTGELISAEPYARVTWASGIDLETGRPIEAPGARYPDGSEVEIWPSGVGAHNWMPMAFSPNSGLAYIPRIDYGMNFTDRDVDIENWQPPTDRADDFGLSAGSRVAEPLTGTLVAWDPVKQEAVWAKQHPTMVNGGLLATGADLVFQGTVDGNLTAYSATTGEVLWSFDAQAPLVGTPISYTVNGEQYITILTGLGMGVFQISGTGGAADQYQLDARSQARRVLTFKVGGEAELPKTAYSPLPVVDDPDFQVHPDTMAAGQALYARNCVRCHGLPGAAVIQGPDLARSGIVLSEAAFKSVVYDGVLIPSGMPDFKELSLEQVESLRHFVLAMAKTLAAGGADAEQEAGMRRL